jgi:hypothetical protein
MSAYDNILKFSRNKDFTVFFLFAFIFVIYILFGFGVTISNDSTTNIEQITAMNIWSRSSHFSFHLLGVIFYSVFSKLLGLSPITSVEIMLSLSSLAGSISLYFIVMEMFKDQKLGIITVIIYAFSTGIFRFSIQSEYLVLVPSFSLVSLALYSGKKYFMSGLFFAFGFLTSPFVLLVTPAFFLYNDWKKIFQPKNYWFMAGFLSIYILISYFTFEETINGNWSYSVVFNEYKTSISELNCLRMAAIWAYGYLRSFSVIIPIFIISMLYCYKTYRKLFLICLVLIIIHLPVAIQEARYGGYQLTFYPFFALISAIGLNIILKKSQTVAILILLLFLGINFFFVSSERNFNRSLRDTYVMLEKDPSIPDSSILFVYQATKPIQTIYAPKLKSIGLLTSYQENIAEKMLKYEKPGFKEIIEKNQHLYLLESGQSMPDDYLKLMFSGFVKRQGVKIKGFGKEKLQPYLGSDAFKLLKNYPIDVYQINK